MFLLTTPRLVIEACKAGIMAGLPRANCRSLEEFDAWLKQIRTELDAFHGAHPGRRIGPVAVNLSLRVTPEDEKASLEICRRHAVDIIITAAGDPSERVKRIHDWGGKLFHDCTSIRFAEKAVAAGVDGIVAIGSGGGGHSGTVNHLVLVPKIRQMYDGVIVMAGAVANGAAIRAAEILGADLAYLGTRFIATQECGGAPEYKAMLVESGVPDLLFAPYHSGGVPANWLTASLRRAGLDPGNLPKDSGAYGKYDDVPENARPWKNVWSAGQAIGLIDDLPSVAELVSRLRREYVAACRTPDMSDVARLVDRPLADALEYELAFHPNL